ncbi:unnamed protein product [Caenorhabditis auriculariae]|uniref:phospholipase A2 n=1 Tax=Caenorhabditis auriculariae TaxID=2777116 RepID=A0A8S1HPJ4_9PELO|nr:unnamed protein product [Caenorhabditis auriculariae]
MAFVAVAWNETDTHVAGSTSNMTANEMFLMGLKADHHPDEDEKTPILVTADGPEGGIVLVPADAVKPSESDDNSEACDTPSSTTAELDDTMTHRFLSMVSSILMSTATVQRKASYIVGNDAWVPNDPEEIVEIPEDATFRYKKVHPTAEAPSKFVMKNGDFSVLTSEHAVSIVDNNNEGEAKRTNSEIELSSKRRDSIGSDLAHSATESKIEKVLEENRKKAPLHHLVITLWKSDSKDKKYMLSLYRSRNMADVVALCERCRENPELFRAFPKGVDTKVYMMNILNGLREHILWKSIHLASKIGLVEYFKTVKERKIKNSLHGICQPEGLPPLMIAIQNDQPEIVKVLLDLGADVTAVCADGSSALHIAAMTNPDMIRLLWSTGKCEKILNAPDGNGNSPMYVAVSNGYISCSRCLSSLGASLSAVNSTEAPTPLIGAIKRGKVDEPILNRILEMSPESLNEIEANTGNGVLHSATNKKTLLMFLNKTEKRLDPSARNFLQQTPLHVFVRRGDLALVMGICAHDIDINAVDSSGNTPLHLAVSNANVEIVRILLCLGADPNLINNHKESPRHVAARLADGIVAKDIVRSLIVCGAKSCPVHFIGCTFLCMHRENVAACQAKSSNPPFGDRKLTEDDKVNSIKVDKDAPTGAYEFELDPETQLVDEAYVEKNETRLFPHLMAVEQIKEKLKLIAEKKNKSHIINVLSLDGGGIRGLVMCQVLLELQKRLESPIFSYFDWVGATSTGSFIASALMTDVLFDSWSRPYNTTVLENFIQTSFGMKNMSEYEYPKAFFTTVRADTFPVQLELSRNYRLPLSEEENKELGFVDPKEIPLWRAARRSSAAPTYFFRLLKESLSMAIHFWNTSCQRVGKPERMVEIGCVLSVGTGVTPICPVDPSVFEMSDFMGLLRGIKNLSLVVLDQATATEGAPVTRSRSWCHSLGVPYFRLNAPLFKDILLDSNEDKELAQIMWDSVVYSHTHRKDFDELAELLKLVGTNKHRKNYL